MNQWIFSFIALLLLRSINLCRCIDKYYEACEPKSCGGGAANRENVSYPFWIKNRQASFCGDPGFDVNCNEDNETVIDLFGFNYTIKEFYYGNNSIRVINSDFSSGFSINETCSVPFQDLNLYGDRFEFATNYSKLLFLSKCTDSVTRDLEKYELKGCSNPVFAALEVNVSRVVGNVTGKCGKVVRVPVEVDGVEEGILGSEKGWEYYENEVLRRGFLLNWTATECGVCRKSGGRCGFNQTLRQFMCFCTDRPHFSHCIPPLKKKKNKEWQLALGFGLGMVFIIGVFSIILWCIYKKKYGSEMRPRSLSKELNRSKSYLERGSVYYGVPVFSYCELEEATNNFDSEKELGDGGFGTVYHGVLQDGREVAVKRLYESNYKRVEQFMNEIKIITCLRHKNLVTLYGCTSRHSRELLLVYEYIPNGTVADHLNGNLATTSSLNWPIRLSIAIETASALAYLHASDIIHRDVKTSNILLDSNFCVKVADFGLSRLFPLDATHVSTAPQGTPGYVDPEYHQCYQLTDKSDVYSFGVVLIELISSLPAVDIRRHRHEINLANFAMNKITNRAYRELMDPILEFESDPGVEMMIIAVAELAFRCLQSDKEMRPSMDEVLEVLKRIEQSGGGSGGSLMGGVRPPPSPENDEVVLLGKMRPPFSPVSVTDRWYSTATTPSTSA